jgi:hypothetical protein
MDIWGGVTSFVGNVCSTVGSMVSSAVSSVCSAIGGSLFTGGLAEIAAGIIAPVLPIPGLGELLIAIMVIVKVVGAVAEALGIKKEDETPEELGMKAEIADKKPEDFDSIQEYIKYLREEVEIDKEQVEELSEEDKAKYAVIGSSLYIKDAEERFGIDIPSELWYTAGRLQDEGKLEEGKSTEFIKAGIESASKGDIDLKDMCDYIKGGRIESGADAFEVSDSIVEVLGQVYPELSRDEIYGKLNSLYFE